MVELIEIVPSQVPLVTAKQLFDWCRVDVYAETPEEDENFETLVFCLDAAVSEAEAILGFDLVPKKYKETFNQGAYDFELSKANVATINSVDSEVDYIVEKDGYISYLSFETYLNSLVVEYTTGMAFIPNDILMALRKLVKYYYDNRESEGRKMLTSVEIILMRHKIFRLG